MCSSQKTGAIKLHLEEEEFVWVSMLLLWCDNLQFTRRTLNQYDSSGDYMQ